LPSKPPWPRAPWAAHLFDAQRKPVAKDPAGFYCADQLRQQGRTSSMANTSSAQKAARQTARRTAVNKARRSRLRTTVRDVEAAIAAGDKAAAEQALKAAEPVMMRSAQKGVVHKKTMSRKVSRLAARIKSIGAAAS
jgi:small subunit ribosomal protein S20